MAASANRSSLVTNPWDAPASGIDSLDGSHIRGPTDDDDDLPASRVSLPPSLFNHHSLLDNTRPLISTADSTASLGRHHVSTSSLDYVSPSEASRSAEPEPDPWSATIPKLDDALSPARRNMDRPVEELMEEAARRERTRKREAANAAGAPVAASSPTLSEGVITPIRDDDTVIPQLMDPSAMELEHVKISMAPEKGGFLIKHVNYILHSHTRQASVLRRYSDFLWLLDILVRRYPFRAIPSLPPKKVAADEAFLERRRRALSRFINLIVNHPVLSQDEAVIAFLTVEMEIHTFRKKTEISSEDESKSLILTPAGMAAIPVDLANRIVEFKTGLDFLICQYRDLATLMERIARREDESAVDLTRYSLIVQNLSEKATCTSADCHSCLRAHNGFKHISQGLQRASRVMEDESQSALDGILEELKTHRDLLIACQELFYREERALSALTLDTLRKRIAAQQARLHDVQTKGASKEMERLTASIAADENEVELQNRKIDIIRFVTWSELRYYHKQKAYVSLMYQQYVSEKIRLSSHYSEVRYPVLLDCLMLMHVPN
ncbi:Sorting nexin mvp1 [Thoreauomyces humboldtii]|nr:Sorting nexin mvp1 [Thoreauomyces humboldtii]